MVQLSSRQQPCGTSPRATLLLCRGARSIARSTAVRCFKGNSSDNGAKPSTALRLNFKIPYRVNFGQSLGLVGSGDSLGNWDPKRTVQMKWTDGDWWTVEVTVSPGGALDLEYKYVVVNADGNIGYWKPGSNYRVTLALSPSGTKVLRRVKVADAWDDSFKKVDVEEAEAAAAIAASAGASSQPAGAQAGSQPASRGQPQPTTTAAAPKASASATPAPSTAPPPAAAAAAPAAKAAPAAAAPSQNGVPRAASTQAAPQARAGSEVQTPSAQPAAEPAAQTAASTAPQASTSQADAGTRVQSAAQKVRAGSPRSPPPNFQAATTIPAIHPSLMAEQERLEDGVRNSLEDLQAQMDKHQQLRERTEDPAAPEILVADRIVAAANNRVVAYNKALKAVQEYNRLPPSGNVGKQQAAAEDDKQ